jgi:putative phage-type endonuclease
MSDYSEYYEFVVSSDDRLEWLKARRTGIGASESAGILGVSRWCSGLSVYAEKIDPDPPRDDDNQRMAWGRDLEAVILQHYRVITGREAWPSKAMLRSKQWPWLFCTEDARTIITGMEGPLELKNTQDRAGWSDGLPRDIWVQCQHQMAVTGAQVSSVAVLIAGCDFKTKDVARDHEFISSSLVPDTQYFWELVEKRGPPPQTDGSEASRRAMKRLYPVDSGDRITLDGSWIDRADRRVEIILQRKELGEELDLLENQIRQEIGEAKATYAALANGGEFSWKANKNGAKTLRYSKPPGG